MIPLKASNVLFALCSLTDKLTDAPWIAALHREEAQLLRDETGRAIARPAENERVIDDVAGMLATALLAITKADNKADVDRWCRIALALRPHVEGDYKRALEAELEQLRSARWPA